MTDFPVLVVSGGLFQGLGIVECLRDGTALRVLVADAFAENVTRHFADGAFVVPPASDTDAFVSALLGICERDGVRLVLPATAHELPALAAARERFEKAGVSLAVSAPELIGLSRDKSRLGDALRAAGLPVLPEVDPETADLPLLGKPRLGFGGRDHLVLRDETERDEARRTGAFAGRAWQRLLHDPEEISVDFAIAHDGTVGAIGLRRRVRTSGGFAVVSETTSDPIPGALVPAVTALLVAHGGRGLFNVQFLIESSPQSGRTAWLTDVNPRFGTSAVHWIGTAANGPRFLCAALGAPAPTRGADTAVARRRTVRRLTSDVVDAGEALSRNGAGIEAVAFDLDDTLVSHKEWMLGSLSRLSEAPPVPLPADFLLQAARILEEGGAARLFDALVEQGVVPADARAALIERYRASRPARLEPFPDVAPTLHALRRRGYRLGLITDNPPESQREKLRASGLEAAFDAVVFTRDEGGEKPAPGGFLALARRLGLAPGALAMVGDNPWRDVRGAQEAGYGAAFLVSRRGGLLNVAPALAERLLDREPRPRSIEGLQPLLVWLSGAASRSRPGPG